MKKRTLSIIIGLTYILITNGVKAQEVVRFDTLGTFDNLHTVYDSSLKKERLLTKDEVKTNAIAEVTKRLQNLKSKKLIDTKNVQVLERIVIVPLTEFDGTAFYDIVIDKKSGLSNQELFQAKAREKELANNQAWENIIATQEEHNAKVKNTIKEFREKNPTNPENKFKIKMADEIYKPKAPTRKIIIK